MFQDDRRPSAQHTTGYGGTRMHNPTLSADRGEDRAEEHVCGPPAAPGVSPPPIPPSGRPETDSGEGRTAHSHGDDTGAGTNLSATDRHADRTEGTGRDRYNDQESTDASLVRVDERSDSVEAISSPRSSLSSTSTTVSIEMTIPLEEEDSPGPTSPPVVQDEDSSEPLGIDFEDCGSGQTPRSLSRSRSPPAAEEASPRWDRWDRWDHSQPIVCSRWHAASRFTHAGGALQKPHSDVILRVPPGAVDKECSVTICTAVCANVNRIEHVLNLPEEDVVISPFVEYWAGRDYRFKRPVTIVLPHVLPPDYDLSKVRVYRVVMNNAGPVVITRLRHVIDNDAHNDSDSSLNSRQTSGTNQQNAQEARHSESENIEPVVEESASSTAVIPQEYGAQSFQDQPEAEDVVWEKSCCFRVSSDGQVYIYTDCFSGYVCTHCGRSLNQRPALYAMAYGRHRKLSGGQRDAGIDLYVWDARTEITDFRQVRAFSQF